ncbi:MAG: hypothetical protein ACR2K6_11625 [Solirubrobacterales bacterium]
MPYAVLRQCELDGNGGADGDGIIDVERIVRAETAGDGCEHAAEAKAVRPSAAGCTACMRSGHEWVQLRMRLTKPLRRGGEGDPKASDYVG